MQYYYGHACEWVEMEDPPDDSRYTDELRYVDTGELCWEVPIRPCPKCGEAPSEDNHDPCIRNLPGVAFACCGHGVEQGYIKFEDGRVFRFEKLSPSTTNPHPLMLKKAREG